MARSRPVSKFKSYTHQALCDWSKGITLALTGNLSFPSPPVTLVAQGAANDAFQAAILAWGPLGNRGSHAQHVALINARKVVEENIRNLEGYVNGISAGDAGMILSAGMVANNVPNPFGVLPAPVNFRSPFSKHTLSGQTRLRWNKVKGANSYNVYTAATPTDPFVLIGNTTDTLFIGTGAAGRLGYYTVRALGAEGLGIETTPLAAYSML
jgi:hypothetical protein